MKKFKEIAEYRVNKAINKLNLISKLSNTNSYTYDKEQTQKIINALEKKLKEIKEDFKDGIIKLEKGNKPFKF